MTEKQLNKEKRLFVVMQFVWMVYALLFVLLLTMGPEDATVWQRISFTALIVGGIGAAFSMYVNYRLLETEINFELRFRKEKDAYADYVEQRLKMVDDIFAAAKTQSN
jgi:hypothetical protein